MKTDFSSSLAADMDKALVENKDMFSQAAMLEKLAFTRVADEDKIVSEIEIELNEKEAEKAAEKVEFAKSASAKPVSIMDSFNTLLKVSEDLDAAGFEKLAAASLMLANHVICAAKGKSSKTEKSKSKSKEKSKSDKSKSKSSKKPMSKSERMKKLREMNKGKKKVSKAQDQRPVDVQFGTPGAQTAKAPAAATPAPQALGPGVKTPESQAMENKLKQAVQQAAPELKVQWQSFHVGKKPTGVWDVSGTFATPGVGGGSSSKHLIEQAMKAALPQGSTVNFTVASESTGGAQKPGLV